MKLPTSLEFFGVKWRVAVVSERTLRHRADGASIESRGFCHVDKRVIYVKRGLPHEEQYEVLFHEMVHAAISEGFNSDGIGLDLRAYEEPVVDIVTRGMLPAMRQLGWGHRE